MNRAQRYSNLPKSFLYKTGGNLRSMIVELYMANPQMTPINRNIGLSSNDYNNRGKQSVNNIIWRISSVPSSNAFI